LLNKFHNLCSLLVLKKTPQLKMKKLLGVILILIVIKCYAMTKAPNVNPIALDDREVTFEGGVSILIAVGVIYGSKVGRNQQKQEEQDKQD